jgi:hypothetical protein
LHGLIVHISEAELKPPRLTTVARRTGRNIQADLFQDYLPQSNLSFLVMGLQQMSEIRPAEQTSVAIKTIDASHTQSRDEHFVSLS